MAAYGDKNRCELKAKTRLQGKKPIMSMLQIKTLEGKTGKIIHEKNSIFPSVFEWLKNYPQLENVIPKPLTLSLIIDTNIIIGDLLWLIQKRENEKALTCLLEILQTKTVRAYAPKHLAKEISQKIPVVSKEKNISSEKLFKVWNEYKKYITFVPHKKSLNLVKRCERDPKDLSFLALQIEYGYPIYTKDRDISGMGGAVITTEVIAGFRDYTRYANISYTINIAGIGSIFLTGMAIKSLCTFISRIPKKFIGFGLAIFVLLLINKSSREYIFRILRKVKDAAPEVIDAFVTIMYCSPLNN